ncbi:cobalamin-dependent protein [candidate division KSB1 bacterium]|nr:cobalamin-dependent protein [candidate division KSB1 bacterium]
METLDCLLVHVPKKHNFYPPLNHYSSINWMAHGILALADALTKGGFKTRVLHVGIERVLEPSFRLSGHPAIQDVKAVGFSMQFHQQLVDTLAEAAELKKQRPDCFIFLGGMTASFFARELLTEYPFIDAIITGEGEFPSVKLLQLLKSGQSDYAAIPNLVWRKNGGLVVNQSLYRASEDDADRMSFANLSYLQHHSYYLNFPKIIFHTRLPGKWNVKLAQVLHSEKKNFFPGLLVGRGCYANCFYCGGGSIAQKAINHRTGVIFRKPVFFSIGIPHETEADFKKTLALKRQILATYKKTSVKAFVIEIEPGAPWHLHPEKYGIHLRRRTLPDFIADHKRPDYSSMRCLGFTKSDFWGKSLKDEQEFEAKLLKLKCRYFCEQRRICPFLSAFWRMARLLHLTRTDQVPGK